jgi:NADPH:quinone reductase-like Zn-dependent oxidoreductase
MRAVAISEYGGSPVVTELPKPKAGPGQLLIKVHAASVNPMDRNIAGGGWKEQMPGTFPMVLGADMAGVVEALGEGATKFSPGDEVFGQLLVAPLGSAGTYAEDIAVAEEAPLAPVPAGLDPVVAAALPTAGGTALDIVELLEPLAGKTVLIVGAAGGVGSFATQFAANAGAQVIANAHESAHERMRSYGATETVDHNLDSVMHTVAAGHPDGIDILIDVASDAEAFAELGTLVKRGGTALTTKSVADNATLDAGGITGVNYVVSVSPELLERVADELVAGRIAAPPIRDIRLDEVPAAFKEIGHGDGKTVITMGTDR